MVGRGGRRVGGGGLGVGVKRRGGRRLALQLIRNRWYCDIARGQRGLTATAFLQTFGTVFSGFRQETKSEL